MATVRQVSHSAPASDNGYSTTTEGIFCAAFPCCVFTQGSIRLSNSHDAVHVCTGYMTRLPSLSWLANQYFPVAEMLEKSYAQNAMSSPGTGSMVVSMAAKIEDTTVPLAP